MKKHSIFTKSNITRFISASAAVLLTVSSVQPLYADQYDEQIQQKQAEANRAEDRASQYQAQATTLTEQLARLNTQIQSIKEQIAANQAKKAKLVTEITQAEKDIEVRSEALANNLRQMYLEGEISSLEKVASSKSISEFVDKQEYRNEIQGRVSTAMDEIEQLKSKLEDQKRAVDQSIKDDEGLRSTLANKQSQQAELLAVTKGKQANYEKAAAKSRSEIESLRAQQQAANARMVGYSGADYSQASDYPWPNASMEYDDGCNYYSGGSGADPWGYCYRQCTSYVAFKLAQRGVNPNSFSGMGHAGNWTSSSMSYGGGARKGDVAVWPEGGYGHVMHVESVNPDGTINISEYNLGFYDGNPGKLSHRYNLPQSSFTFLHF